MTQDQNKSVSEHAELSGFLSRFYDALPASPNDAPDDSRELWYIYEELRQYTRRAPTVPAAAMVMQPVDERALFEKWAKSKGHDVVSRLETGGKFYVSSFTRHAWDIWQARAALSAGPTQAADKRLEGAKYVAKLAQADIDAVYPPAAEQTATTASTSIDTPEFREIVDTMLNGYWDPEPNIAKLIAFIDSRAQAPSRDAPAAQGMTFEEWWNKPHPVTGHPPAATLAPYSAREGWEAATWQYIFSKAAAQAVERAAPDGWKLVPVEPTRAMLKAAWDEANAAGELSGPKETWSTMINAAPAATAVEQNSQ